MRLADVLPDPPPSPATAAEMADGFPFRRGAMVHATFATSELHDFLHNWIHHARLVKLENIFVIALDDKIADVARFDRPTPPTVLPPRHPPGGTISPTTALPFSSMDSTAPEPPFHLISPQLN